MSKYRAAILPGPRGPFAVIELTAAQQQQLSADDRQHMTRCFKDRHRNMPVVFVTASPSTLHAIHGYEVTEDLQQCLCTHNPTVLPWMHFDHQPAAGESN